ncbi:RNA polymerase sigma factor [Paenibacillus vietnamensis]|uniref:RNA polymerase sigma factor n=1 Tax=Paenibacillus vietnamensis TaxID=2590547 RepID=UPI001CD1296A|nr:RNA polymerase sigma factor [Paenibacillus vietnamensis]
MEAAERLAALRPGLERYCRSLTGCNWEAEDLAQDTFIKVLKRCRAEPGFAPGSTYVFRAARNLWIDGCRRRRLRTFVPLDEQTADSAVESAGDCITRELLEQLMHRLLPKPFVILLQCDVFGMTAKETASCMDMSEGTVQVTLSRARKRLRMLALREPESDAAVRKSAVRSSAAASVRLLEAVTEAFRLQNPRLIHDAYIRLYESGSHLAALRLQAGRYCFTFRDPEGNLLMVSE